MDITTNQSINEPLEEEQVNARQFIPHRGSILVKEFNEIAKLKGQSGDSILVTCLIFTMVKGTNRHVTHRVRLEQPDMDISVILDFDELPEVMGAFAFIGTLSNNLKSKNRNYTEVIYSTKDDADFGFYQDDERQQQGFIKMNPNEDLIFINLSDFIKLKDMLLKSQKYLISRGANKG